MGGGASDDYDLDPDMVLVPERDEPVQYEFEVWSETSHRSSGIRAELKTILNKMTSEGWTAIQINNFCAPSTEMRNGIQFDSVVIFRRPKKKERSDGIIRS